MSLQLLCGHLLYIILCVMVYKWLKFSRDDKFLIFSGNWFHNVRTDTYTSLINVSDYVNRTAKYLMNHLQRISHHGRQTGMHCKNLAIVWAPNLLRYVLQQFIRVSSQQPQDGVLFSRLQRCVDTLRFGGVLVPVWADCTATIGMVWSQQVHCSSSVFLFFKLKIV